MLIKTIPKRLKAKRRTVSIAPNKVTLATQEMKMNRLEFGEIVFGGDLKKNLMLEVNMNKKIDKKKKVTN